MLGTCQALDNLQHSLLHSKDIGSILPSDEVLEVGPWGALQAHYNRIDVMCASLYSCEIQVSLNVHLDYKHITPHCINSQLSVAVSTRQMNVAADIEIHVWNMWWTLTSSVKTMSSAHNRWTFSFALQITAIWTFSSLIWAISCAFWKRVSDKQSRSCCIWTTRCWSWKWKPVYAYMWIISINVYIYSQCLPRHYTSYKPSRRICHYDGNNDYECNVCPLM